MTCAVKDCPRERTRNTTLCAVHAAEETWWATHGRPKLTVDEERERRAVLNQLQQEEPR